MRRSQVLEIGGEEVKIIDEWLYSIWPRYEYQWKGFYSLNQVEWMTNDGWEVMYICKGVGDYEVQAFLKKRIR